MGVSALDRKFPWRVLCCCLWAVGPIGIAMLQGQPAAAQSLKKKVMENCPEALAEAQTLNLDQRKDLVDYLKLVLKLQGEPPNMSALPPAQKGAPVFEPQNLGAWMSFDPSRDIEAKRCATELLQSLGAVSLEAVADLIKAAEDPLLPDDLVAQMEEVAFDLAVAAGRDPRQSPSEDLLSALLELALKGRSWPAVNVLFEIQSAALPYLTEQLRRVPESALPELNALLLNIDSQGQVIGPWLLKLLASGEEETNVRALELLSKLPAVYPRLLAAVVERLPASSGKVRDALFSALELMVKDPQLSSSMSADRHMVGTLFAALKSSSGRQRNIVEWALLVLGIGNPELVKGALDLAGNADAELRRCALSLLGQSEESSDEIFKLLAAALDDPVLEVRLEAIKALGRQFQRTNEVLSLFARTLRANAAERDAGTKRTVLLTFASALDCFSAGKAAVFLAPYLIEALAYKEAGEEQVEKWPPPQAVQKGPVCRLAPHPAVSALIGLGRDAVPLLVKAVRSTDAGVRKRAAYALGRIKPADAAAVGSLVNLLKDDDYEVRLTAQASLVLLGREVAHDVRRGLRRGPLTARLAAAEVLLALGNSDEILASILREAIAQQPCWQRGRLTVMLARIQPRVGDDIALRLVECLQNAGEAANSLLEGLVRAAPLSEPVQEKVSELLLKASGYPEVHIKLLARVTQLGFANDKLIPLLTSVLERDQDTVRYMALRALGELGERAALPTLGELFRRKSDNFPLRNEVVLAMTSIDEKSVDLREYLLEQLQKEGFESSRVFLGRLKPRLVLLLLEDLLKRDLPEKARTVLVRAAGDLGELAVGVVPDLEKLLFEKDVDLRKAALVALLRISPKNPQLMVALRKALLGSMFKSLAEERLPAAVVPLLESIIMGATSNLERRNARILKERAVGAANDGV